MHTPIAASDRVTVPANLHSQMASTSPSSKGLTTSAPFGPPFDDADTDIILRSSDRVDFYVYRVILSISSSFFKTMFLLPQPDASVSEKKNPVIDMTENSRTIAILLTFIYPIVSVVTEPISLDGMMDALVAARKYDMPAVSRCLNANFAESKVVQDSPVEAFCAAYSHELGEAARVAAMASLKHRMRWLDDIGDKLRYTNGPGLCHLWNFHRACSATAAEAVSGRHLGWIKCSHTWSLAHNSKLCIQAPACTRYRYTVGPSRDVWYATDPWHDYITRARNILSEHPCREAVAHYPVLKPSYEDKTCKTCQSRWFGLLEYIYLLGEEVEKMLVANCPVLNKEKKRCLNCQNSLLDLPEFINLLGEEVEKRVLKVKHFSCILP
jgi:hypothetical protein